MLPGDLVSCILLTTSGKGYVGPFRGNCKIKLLSGGYNPSQKLNTLDQRMPHGITSAAKTQRVSNERAARQFLGRAWGFRVWDLGFRVWGSGIRGLL